jgi:hypothetical protein
VIDRQVHVTAFDLCDAEGALHGDGANRVLSRCTGFHFHENALVPAEFGDRGGRKLDAKWIIDGDVQITRNPEDVVVVVAGGPGRHTMICHSFGTSSESVTELIKLKDETAASSVLDFKK